MKKILSTAAAIALAASLISCGDSGDSYSSVANGAVDTVLSISAPVVTKSVAYAGVNYIAWNPVADAKGYEIYRTADGAEKGTQLVKIDDGKLTTAYADVAKSDNVLVDGVTYNYTIVALGANGPAMSGTTIPARSIYLRPSSTTTSVKAYVPAAGTKITDFTDLYTKNFISANYKDAETAKKNVKITFNEDELSGGKFVSTFPATAGYQFGVKLINETQLATIRKSNVASSFTSLYIENYKANTEEVTLAAGKYKAYVTMKSVCGFYPTPVVYEVGEVTVNALSAITATGTPVTTWKDKDNVVIRWTPAVLASGLAPVENYKVYRTTGDLNDGSDVVAVLSDTVKVVATDYYSNEDTNDYDTVVSSTGVSTGKNTITKQYYVTDKVPANNVKYTYFVVNTANGEYEAFTDKAYNSATINPYAQQTTDIPTITGVAISKDKDNLYNVIKISYAKANHKQTVAATWIKLDDNVTSGNDYVKTLDTTKFNKVDLTNNDVTEDSYISYVEKATTGTYLVKVTATEAGKAEQSRYQIVYVTGAAVDARQITITQSTPTAISDNKAVVVDTLENADTLNLYTYKLVKVEQKYSTTALYSNYVTVTSTTSDLTLKVDTVETTDFIDGTKDYAKYGVPSAGVNGTKTTTKPYAIVSDIKGGSSSTGVTQVYTFSVQKILKTNVNDYGFSDKNTNGQIDKWF